MTSSSRSINSSANGTPTEAAMAAVSSWRSAAAVYCKAINTGGDVGTAMYHITQNTSPTELCEWIRSEPGFANVVRASSQICAENPEIAQRWFGLVEHVPDSGSRDEVVTLLLSYFPQIHRFGSSCVFGSALDACALMRSWTRRGMWLEALQLGNRYGAAGAGLLPAATMNAMCTGKQWAPALQLLTMSTSTATSSSSLARMKIETTTGERWGEVEVAQLASTLREQRASWLAAALLVSHTENVSFTSPAFYNHVLRVFATGRRWVEALNVMSAYIDVPLPLVDLEGAGRAKSRQQQQQLQLQLETSQNNKKLSPNVVTLTEICACLQHARKWVVALSIASSCLTEGPQQQPAAVPRETLDAKAIKSIVRCCLAGNRWFEAVSLLNNNTSSTTATTAVTLDPLTYENALTLCNRAKQHKLATKLLQLVSKSGNRDAITRATNSMLQYAPTHEARQQWLQVMEARKLPFETETYFTLIQHTSSQAKWVESLQYLNKFDFNQQQQRQGPHQQRFVPSYVHDYLQFGLSTGGAPWTVSLQLYCMMDARRVALSDVSFKAVVGTCLRSGQTQKAQELLKLMIRSGITR